MRFDIDVYDTEVVELLNRFVSVTGPKPWSRKFQVLTQQLKENPFLGDWQLEHHGIELKLRELLVEQERGGRFPVPVQDQAHYELYGFVSTFVRIYERLSATGQTRLRGMLLDGLKPDNTLLSVQNELTTAVHLISRGFDVEMNDLENGRGVDFIAEREGLAFEVECKVFTGDLGRKLHRRKVLALHKHLAETFTAAFRKIPDGQFIRITLPDRLHCSSAQLGGIQATVANALQKPLSVVASQHCEAEVLEFEMADSPFIVPPEHLSKAAVSEFISTRFGRTNREMVILFSPAKRALVALVESAAPDQVLKGIYRQLRESAMGQFTKTRPGILAVQFQDLSAEDIADLGKADAAKLEEATGLQLMTSHFLNSQNRAHIHTVAYRSHGNLIEQDEGAGRTSVRAQGLTYFIRNPSNSFHDHPVSRIFS